MAAACKIDLQECLRDSPKFRLVLEREENDIENLESRLEKVIKACQLSVDSGKQFIQNQSAFATSLWDLEKHFQDKASQHALAKIIHCLQEMNKFHTTLLDQATRTILKNLTGFLRGEIKEVKDYKHLFKKVGESLDDALYKNAQVNKNRPLEVTEAENFLAATVSCFRHTALDYVNLITLLQSKKRMEILTALLSYIQACSTFYHEGSDLLEDFGGYFKNLDEQVTTMRSEFAQLEKLMQNRHALVNEFEANPDAKIEGLVITMEAAAAAGEMPSPAAVDFVVNNVMEGYLFKRTSNAFKTWNRRWFVMRNNQLFYRKRSGEELPTVMEEDLRLCHVRPLADIDRRYCFEVISPTKSHILQADSEQQYHAWIKALQGGIDAAFQQPSLHSNMCGAAVSESTTSSTGGSDSSLKRVNWQQILQIPGNKVCCDCGCSDPKWASINLGVTLCIACSGVHRSLGVHHSKVRSLTLDVWEPEVLRVLLELGNGVINQIYEARVPTANAGFERPGEASDRAVREQWIRAKYVERRFVLPMGATAAATTGDEQEEPPQKWSVRKIRRRSGTRRPRPRDEDKDLDSSARSARILIIGEKFGVSSPAQQPEKLVQSDQESTSGDESSSCIDEEDMDNLTPNFLLYKAALAHNLPVMCQALALGADKDWSNDKDFGRTPLHQAILSGSVMACEFLLLNGAQIDATDRNGATALHLATEKGYTALAYLLLKHKAQYDQPNKAGKRAIDLAVEQANADIVTLLRLTQLNAEIGAEDTDPGGDLTYNDVMRDFSNLTCGGSGQPNKLQRRQDADTASSGNGEG